MTRAASLDYEYACGLARAFAGAIIFSLPLLMTMEMWAIGLYVAPVRLLMLIAFNFVILVFLSRFGGFERTATLAEDLLDALAAYAVGMVCAFAFLSLFGLIDHGAPLDERVGQIAIQCVPASFGAMIARKQLGGGEREDDMAQAERSAGYGGQLFLMLAGALFLAFNVAPTEEMMLISYQMTPLHSAAIVSVSLALLHALVFAVGLAGQEDAPEGYGQFRLFAIFTVPGYAIALLASLYVLWTFGSIDGAGPVAALKIALVLALPAALGAAMARLVV